jgi:MFS transporter, MHS family, shikimate and dehydroshikimate transport protein
MSWAMGWTYCCRPQTGQEKPRVDFTAFGSSANATLSLSDIPMILVFGLLSDYIGRRKMFLTGMAVLALFAVPFFMLVSTSNIWLFLLGGLIVQACRSAVYGPQSAYFAEQFSTRMRYSGSSLAYQFAAIIGGMAPLICTALVALTGTLYSVGAFVLVVALLSFTCSYLMTETLRTGLRSDEILSPPSKVEVQAPGILLVFGAAGSSGCSRSGKRILPARLSASSHHS